MVGLRIQANYTLFCARSRPSYGVPNHVTRRKIWNTSLRLGDSQTITTMIYWLLGVYPYVLCAAFVFVPYAISVLSTFLFRMGQPAHPAVHEFFVPGAFSSCIASVVLHGTDCSCNYEISVEWPSTANNLQRPRTSPALSFFISFAAFVRNAAVMPRNTFVIVKVRLWLVHDRRSGGKKKRIREKQY